MKTVIKIVPVAAVLALMAACGTTGEQRAASGALGGAVVGQAVGGNTSSTVAGAAIGAVAGVATKPR